MDNATDNKKVMLNLIETFEAAHRQANESKKIVNFQMHTFLPTKLHRRVNKLVNLKDLVATQSKTDAAADPTDGDDSTTFVEPKPVTTRQETFNESTLQEILDKEMEFVDIVLKIDPPPEPRKPVRPPVNWMATFLRSPVKDRVRWPSKIHQFDKKFSKKTLFEQTEQLMDLAAEDFAVWLNQLGSEGEAGGLDKNIIKQLFSIGIDGDSSKALYVEPKAKKAIPHEVADTLKCPELSIERNVSRLLFSDEKNRSKMMKRFAFGSALPQKLQMEKARGDIIVPLEPNFPQDLRSKRSLFKGITHLRSTKTLVDYIKANPNVERPAYLVEKGAFRRQPPATAIGNHEPLYAYFYK